MQPGSLLRLMEPLKEEGTDIWQGDEALDESWVYIPSHSTAVQIPSLSPIHFNHYPEESEQLNKVSILWQNVGLSITFSHNFSSPKPLLVCKGNYNNICLIEIVR